jgi:hypothetical protein
MSSHGGAAAEASPYLGSSLKELPGVKGFLAHFPAAGAACGRAEFGAGVKARSGGPTAAAAGGP